MTSSRRFTLSGRAALFALALQLPMTVAGSAPLDSSDAELERMMAKRHAVQKLAGPKATDEELRQAITRFQELMGELQSPPLRDMGNGDLFLRNERLNNQISLAEAYVRLGMKDKALDALERSTEVAWLPFLAEIDKRPSLAALAGEPRMALIKARNELGGKLFKVPGIAVPYKEKLSVEERIAGLSLFWHEVRQHFVYFDHVPKLDWDKVFLEYIGKVSAAETTRDYYDVLMRLAPLLQDGHTNIFPPEQLVDQFYARPPVRTALIEDRVIVLGVNSPSLEKSVRMGDEIVAIDGMPVKAYAEQRVAPYASSSTPQDKQVRTYSYGLLSGPAERPLQLALLGADGKRREVTVARSGYQDVRKRPQFEVKTLGNNVVYIALDHFESDESIKAFESALPAIYGAKALIIDVRNNGGGSSGYGHRILSYLSNKPVVGAASHVRSDNPVIRAQWHSAVSWMRIDKAEDAMQPQARIFSGPVAVLAGPRSFSAAEDFLVAYDMLERGIIVGEATGGSTGQPLSFQLPGGGRARVCVKRDTYQDGRAFVGRGVQPHIEVRPTVQSVRLGKDPVLDKALAALSSKMK